MKSVCTPSPRKLWLFLIFTAITAISQAQILKGVVRDSASNPLVGAIIQLKGTAAKTTSMIDGIFAINLNGISSTNAILEISYTGYQSMQIPVKGSDNLTVVLAEKKEVLQEVVVTALGIRREEKSLGYAAQTVKENAVKDAKPITGSIPYPVK